MNHHLRFADSSSCPRGKNLAALALCALAVPLFTSCQSNQLLSLSESVPPKLAKDKPLIQYQCYFFTAPDEFELLRKTEGVHIAGIYSPADGEKLVASLKRKRAFKLQSAPSMTSRQGQRGTIEMIREFIYPTEYEAPKIASKKPDAEAGIFPVTPATPTSFETTHLGITAEFEGTKTSNREIEFKFTLTRRTFMGFVNYGSPITAPAETAFGKPVDVIITENRIEMPVFDTKRMASTVALSDGHFLAIGGLTADAHKNLKNVVRSQPNAPDFPSEKESNLFVLIQVKAVDRNGN